MPAGIWRADPGVSVLWKACCTLFLVAASALYVLSQVPRSYCFWRSLMYSQASYLRVLRLIWRLQFGRVVSVLLWFGEGIVTARLSAERS